MNKCEMRRQFICGIYKSATDTCFNDYECEYSGKQSGDSSPCEFRSFVGGRYECQCMGAIMECITEDEE